MNQWRFYKKGLKNKNKSSHFFQVLPQKVYILNNFFGCRMSLHRILAVQNYSTPRRNVSCCMLCALCTAQGKQVMLLATLRDGPSAPRDLNY
jgi:hypothetical protein